MPGKPCVVSSPYSYACQCRATASALEVRVRLCKLPFVLHPFLAPNTTAATALSVPDAKLQGPDKPYNYNVRVRAIFLCPWELTAQVDAWSADEAVQNPFLIPLMLLGQRYLVRGL